MKYQQLILVEFDNCSPFLYRIVGNKKITLKKVVKYFQETEDFNEERDSITFLENKIIEISIK